MRLDDWPEALEAVLSRASREPFQWGRNDCCLFAADCVDAMTGSSIAGRFRGRYTTALGAARVLKREGGLEAILGALFEPLKEIECAGRGDLVQLTLEIEGMQPLGIVDLSGRRVAVTGPEGLVYARRDQILKGWRVE